VKDLQSSKEKLEEQVHMYRVQYDKLTESRIEKVFSNADTAGDDSPGTLREREK